MMRPIQTQTTPDQPGCPTVLIEGRPVTVLDSSSESGTALPRVLASGQPITVVSPNRNGAATVLGGSEK